ncbi:MAG TPA: tetratricopeptide repeat protein, partial [Ignavibacteriaceae bacterium]|nr:tetratricopeptide repeat protein [Ignavibacteriaceae bacterium]
NTYQAKLEYYQNNDRTQFLEVEVLEYFSKDEFVLIWIPFLVGVSGIIKSIVKNEENKFIVYLLFIIGLISVYYIKLPFAHRFGRYLMPVIPFYILISVYGIKIIFDFVSNRFVKRSALLPNAVFIIYVLILAGIFINQNKKSQEEFTFFSKYHNDRHVSAGRWLKENTNESDVIATHDVGAIAFYSERKIIDMAGLITPELIAQINQRSYSEYLNNYLAKNKVEYVVTLKNWFEVVNDKPVFVPINQPEFLEIYKYNKSRTHIQPKEVSQLNQAAIQMFQNNAGSNALAYLNQSLQLDNKSSQTYFLLGAVNEILKDYSKAEENLKRAIELNPDYAEAYYGLAKINFDQNRIDAAENYLMKCLAINPDYQPALQLRERLTTLIKN